MPSYVSSYFSPNRGTADVIIGFIDRCDKTLDIAVYSITHDSIVDALLKAKKRGVHVRVITDSTQAAGRYSDDEKLEAALVEVHRVGVGWRRSMHNKFVIGDNAAVGTGSFNWTKNADKHNNENFVIIRLRYVVRDYQREFKRLWALGNDS
jgi:phosphatidylserine/phosphatidylglycerophosphate/cardiolipin synthase-like enzyme